MTPLPHFIAGGPPIDYEKIKIKPYNITFETFIEIDEEEDGWYWVRQIKDNEVCWYNVYIKERKRYYTLEPHYEGEIFEAMEKKYRHHIREKKLKRILE